MVHVHLQSLLTPCLCLQYMVLFGLIIAVMGIVANVADNAGLMAANGTGIKARQVGKQVKQVL